jgi:2-aminoadipate transaminase
LFPFERLRADIDAVLSEHQKAALAYYGEGGPSEMLYGHAGLRQAIAERGAARDGRPVPLNGVLLANGSTDGLALAVKAFLAPGDGAVVESATYRHTKRFMEATGAEIRSTPMDENGMLIDRLEETLDQLQADGYRPKMIYTIPTFQAPTGTVMPLDRRQALVELAQRRQIMILEDNCYYDFGYDGKPPPTLFALDRGGYVIHSDSFSKYLAPGLRLGWVAGDPEAIAAITRVRQDFAVSQLLARAVERTVRSGFLEQHLAELRHHYKTKRDLTTALLRKYCGDSISFHEPAGGFFFWIRFNDRIDADVALRTLTERGVAVRGGEWFTGDANGRRYIRLSPIQLGAQDIERGIAILGTVLSELMV